MIKLNGKIVNIEHFPDGTLLLKETVPEGAKAVLSWYFEKNEELLALYFLVGHLQEKGVKDMELKLPYIPNARQDRVKTPEDIFTLKYFARIINSMGFNKVTALDPHSHVSEALIDRIEVQNPQKYVEKALAQIGGEKVMLFFPDEGAMKRYANLFKLPYAFGLKKRDWATGVIQGLEVTGQTEYILGSTVLIVDDICSKGGTFYYSAKALKELGAEKVYLYISHCEDSIYEGELLKTDWVEKIFTTDSIFTQKHEKVEVFAYE